MIPGGIVNTQIMTTEPATRMPNWLRRFIKIWGTVRGAAHLLRPCRVNILLLVVGFVAFGLVPQGQDVLRALAEHDVLSRPIGYFLAATTFWALMIWYWARQMFAAYVSLETRPDESDELDQLHTFLIEHLPRALGAAAFAAVSGAIVLASFATGSARAKLYLLAATFIAFGLLFYVFVLKRRSVLKGTQDQFADTRLGKSFAMPARIEMRAIEARLSSASKKLLGASLIPTFLFFVLFLVNPEGLAPRITTGPILLVALGSWAPIGSLLDYLAFRFRVPVVFALLLSAVGWGLVNDNHTVRTLPGDLPARQSIGDRFNAWLEARAAESDGDSIPLFIVAAEGGGVRAAYWTARVLATLQDSFPTFGKHLFAISGVSGGALGAAAFSSVLADLDQSGGIVCSAENDQSVSGSAANCIDEFFQQDFLSPVLASMLYPDLVQRFLPPVPIFSKRADRARTLEASWEKAWFSVAGTDRFSSSLLNLWSEDSRAEIPTLFFSGTSVESGKRMITTPVSFSNVEQYYFHDLVDVLDTLQRSVRLSTAVHNSARFTYFSPAGTLRNPAGRRIGHIVDGGYFDNSGAVLAGELITFLSQEYSSEWRNRLIPVFILIENETPAEKEKSHSWGNEVLSPLRVMMHARTARASLGKAATEALVGDQAVVNFRLRGCTQQFPLGWMLSEGAREGMVDELYDRCEDDGAEIDSTNLRSLRRIGELLRTFGTAPPQ